MKKKENMCERNKTLDTVERERERESYCLNQQENKEIKQKQKTEIQYFSVFIEYREKIGFK